MIDIFEKNRRLHRKSRTTKHASYPQRFFVPDEKVPWDVPFPEYHPVEFTAPIVLNPDTSWADPKDIHQIKRNLLSFEGDVKINREGIPLNPMGRTGLCGRGVLGKWGANFAVDGLITTVDPRTKQFQVLTIIRKDTGETAIPGGMVDPEETPLQTRNRELNEELSINAEDLANLLYEKTVLNGYVDDPRNTDNAWMETTVIHTHLSFEKVQRIKLKAGDDAGDYRWVNITKETVGNFYANHGLSVLLSIKEMLDQPTSFIDNETRSLFHKLTAE